MQTKLFRIRLANEHYEADQDHINNFLSAVEVHNTANELITANDNPFWSILVFYEGEKTRGQKARQTGSDLTPLNETDKKIFETLKHWRHSKGQELRLPNFMICHNSELLSIVKAKPQNLEEFSRIKGFGPQKIAKFGDEIIAVLNSIAH